MARILHALGEDTQLFTAIGGGKGDYFLSLIKEEGVPIALLRHEEETRVSVVDYSQDQVKSTREDGPKSAQDLTLEALSIIARLLPQSDIVVIAGSVSPLFDTSITRQILEMCAESEKIALCDFFRNDLILALGTPIYLLKINDEEASFLSESLFGERVTIDKMAKRLFQQGVANLIVTSPDARWFCYLEGKQFELTHEMSDKHFSVGSGDAILAGIARVLVRNPDDWDAAIREGVRLAFANSLRPGAGVVSLSEAPIQLDIQIGQITHE